MEPAAVLIVAFRRPETTRQVLEAVVRSGRTRVFVACDGDPDDPDVAEVRRLAGELLRPVQEVSWKHQTQRGGRAFATVGAIDWFFGEVECGIVLQDDLVPDRSFFRYCDELLPRFVDDLRVMSISGTNVHAQPVTPATTSYHFSRFPRTAGFATWRRAWRLYDAAMPSWPQFRDHGRMLGCATSEGARQFWTTLLDEVHGGRTTLWEPQWTYAHWLDNALAVTPRHNLIADHGFDEVGSSSFDPLLRLHGPVQPLPFPLVHPGHVNRHVLADAKEEELEFTPGWVLRRAPDMGHSSGPSRAN